MFCFYFVFRFVFVFVFLFCDIWQQCRHLRIQVLHHLKHHVRIVSFLFSFFFPFFFGWNILYLIAQMKSNGTIYESKRSTFSKPMLNKSFQFIYFFYFCFFTDFVCFLFSLFSKKNFFFIVK